MCSDCSSFLEQSFVRLQPPNPLLPSDEFTAGLQFEDLGFGSQGLACGHIRVMPMNAPGQVVLFSFVMPCPCDLCMSTNMYVYKYL